jgi:hypothetical protein
MFRGRKNKTEESFIAYYGISSKEYLQLLMNENYGIIDKLDNNVFEGFSKSSTQHILENRALTSSMVSRKGNDTVC